MSAALVFQIFKFGIVGGLAFLIDFGVLFVLTEHVGMFYLLSAAIAFFVSNIFNYIASMRFVFVGRNGAGSRKDFFVFFLLSLAGLGINQLGLYFFVERCALFYMYAKFIVTAIVMIWNFTTKKIFLEKR
ncbi:MAG: GtrA family protein [Treponema sp.]|nr:GtrA family protein [Treponema sp.]